MSTQKPPEEEQPDNNPEEWPAPDPEELRLLEEHLDQLEKEWLTWTHRRDSHNLR